MFVPSDHRARARRWLLDLTWGDVTYYVAEDDCTFVDGDGVATDYAAALVVTSEVERPAYVGEGPDAPTAQLELHLADIVDVPARISVGLPLGAMRGVLWLWLEGSSKRERVVDGYVSAVEYGPRDVPVSCQLIDDRLRNRKLWPPANARMKDSAVNPGEYYPWIIGAPGSSLAQDAYGSSGLVWELNGGGNVDYLLVAGHEVGATQVVVENGETGASDLFPVLEDTDIHGRTISYVDLHHAGTSYGSGDRGKNAGYFVRWTGDGGVAIRGEHVKGAGDVLRWALDRTSIDYDQGNVAALLPLLNRYEIDCRLVAEPDKRIDLWEWIQQHLLPILPLSAMVTDYGLRFVHWKYDATSADVVAVLVGGDNAVRIGEVGYSGREEVRNTLRFAYGPSDRTGGTVFRATVAGNPLTLATDDDAEPFAICKRSFRAYGEEVLEFASDVIWDQATAGRIVRERARRVAVQARHIGYEVPPDIGAHLEPGDVVELTDAELSIESALFFVLHKPADAGEFYALHLREIAAQ